jgi:hypothetical protein
LAGSWIGFRNDFWREKIAERITLCLVALLMLSLLFVSLPALLVFVWNIPYPVSLEAILPAEEALLAYLLAVWALKSICIFVAVCSGAFTHYLVSGVCHSDVLWRIVFVVGLVCAVQKCSD